VAMARVLSISQRAPAMPYVSTMTGGLELGQDRFVADRDSRRINAWCCMSSVDVILGTRSVPRPIVGSPVRGAE
jgi:hypothetical protein